VVELLVEASTIGVGVGCWEKACGREKKVQDGCPCHR